MALGGGLTGLATLLFGVYLVSTALFVVRLWVPPGCRHNLCIEPAFAQSDLERADLYVFVSDDPTLLRQPPKQRRNGSPPRPLAHLAAKLLERGSADPEDGLRVALVARNVSLTHRVAKQWSSVMQVPLPPSTRGANGTLWAHVFLVPTSRPLDPAAYPLQHEIRQPRRSRASHGPSGDVAPGRPRSFEESVLYTSAALVTHRPLVQSSTATMLLESARSGSNNASGPVVRAAVDPSDPVSHWRFAMHPLRLRLVAPMTHFGTARLAPDELPINLFEHDDGSFSHRPWLFVEDWTVMGRQLVPLAQDPSREDPRLELQLTRVSLGRFRVFRQLEQAFGLLPSLGLISEADVDEVKRYLTDEYLWRFALMQTISITHAILSFLAFRSDLGFWKGRESVAGLSSRSVMFNAFASTVIFLYLADFSTSYMLLATSACSAAVDLWKVTKVLRLSFSLRHGVQQRSQSRDEQRTAALDATAMDMLALALGPLVFGFALYSLVHQPHRSWYSWVVESLANGIYVFGFVFMTPQLFINHKLQSVAHMPWRVMMYKFFNTFIDDVFSFLVAMPLTHRIACFRDDAVFFVFLYQRWLYPVDKTRANEYGIAYDTPKPTEKAPLADAANDGAAVDESEEVGS